MTPLPTLSTLPEPRLMLLRKYGVNYPDVGRILGQAAEPVTEFDDRLRQLIVDMFHTMYRNDGIGLAANQIGLWLQVAVIDISSGNDPSAKIVLVNPEIIESSGSQVDWEGCLSLPGFREKVKRYQRVMVRAQNECGDEYEIEGEGLLARALQHECRHLDGKTYLDEISSLRRTMVRDKVRKLMRQGKW